MNIFEPLVDDLVRPDHAYRKFLKLLDFDILCAPLRDVGSHLGRSGYDIRQGFSCLLLQWIEDLSDRQMERFLQENNAAKYFCGFSLTQATPDHSYFGRLRSAIGMQRLSTIFENVNNCLKKQGVISGIFTFVDASSMITKLTTWEERDQAIKQGEEKLNNTNIGDYSADCEAKFGCKGKNKYWFGDSRHTACDMKNGIITKVAVTPANVQESKGLALICPQEGMVLADKAYCVAEAQEIMKKNGCHSGAILKNNMKAKNKQRDRFLSQLRARLRKHLLQTKQKRCRYRGVEKTQFQAIFQALAFNIKRLIAIHALPVFAT